jgi:hypothetical protein
VTAARETVWLAALAAVGFALVALATARHGPALFPDSALYLSSAESLREGRGYVLYDGRPYTIAPPLYPTLIASTQRLGIPPATINALAFAGTIFVSGRLLFLSLPPRAALTGTGAIVLAPVLLGQAVAVLTEALFTCLAGATALSLQRFLVSRRRGTLLAAALLTALACLQRYIGVSLVLGGTLLLALRRDGRTLRARLVDVLVFGTIGIVPFLPGSGATWWSARGWTSA